jgi:phosphoglycolate phosphatase-like HAD superfamily hydrolase
MLKALALDFDGVICDGFNECVLVTWYGPRAGALADFGAAGMSAIPPAFVRRFLHCRAFAKHLGHFYVSLLEGIERVRTQADFEALYASVSPLDVEAFVVAVNQYRALVRKHLPEAWLSQQGLYPGVGDFLRRARLPLYVVTAKDAASVAQILEHAGVALAPQHIFGELRDKRAALSQICAAEQIAPGALGVVDDNVLNALTAQRAGFRAYWALWGYRAPDHTTIADENHLPRLLLDQLLSGQDWQSAA